MDHLHITGGLTQPKITKSLYATSLESLVNVGLMVHTLVNAQIVQDGSKQNG